MPMTFKKLRFKFPRLSLFAAGLALAVAPALGSAQGTAESGAATSGVIPTVVTSVGELATVPAPSLTRSEEHTSELQSLMRISYAVFCLKKKNKLQLANDRN